MSPFSARTAFSALTGRLFRGKTMIEVAHGGAASRPALLGLQHTEAAICTMGARNGRLRESLEMRMRVEKGATLMVDSISPTRLLPANEPGAEYGIGIHASVEEDALLVIAPNAHVPHAEAYTGLWTRYDVSPHASLVSVQLADLRDQIARPPAIGGRYTVRTRVHQASDLPAAAPFDGPCYSLDDGMCYEPDESSGGDDGQVGTRRSISDSCVQPSVSSCGVRFAAEPSWQCDWTYGRRFQGLVMGTPTTNVIATVLIAGPRARAALSRFRSIEGRAETHEELGAAGQVHLALQELPIAGGLTVVRVATTHVEDMHRLLHHGLSPLLDQLGVEPYSRSLLAGKTAAHGTNARAFADAPLTNADATGRAAAMMHVQHMKAAPSGA